MRHFTAVEIFLSICLGIGLSAACGFRVFVPLLCLSIASHTGHVHLVRSFAWIGSDIALVTFAVATFAEVVAYYVPWLDNALDTVAIPVATIAGILVTASVVTDVDPFWRWSLAVIAGGGIAASTQIATTKARATSSLTTGGFANPVVATAEATGSTALSIIAMVWPILGLVLVIAVLAACWMIIWFVGKRLLKLWRRKPESSITPAA